MYSVVVAFGLASFMLCIGIVIRAKVPFIGHMLIPSSVIAGVLGLIFVNLVVVNFDIGGATVTDFSNIVDVFFVLSFISIGLTGSKKQEKPQNKKAKKKSTGIIRGPIGMALIWCALYGITAAAGVGIVSIIGKLFDMDAMYGILIPFAFCQGPGQASTYGRLFEYTYGYENAEMVALAFAAIGFVVAFGVGVPIARYGLKKGLAKSGGVIDLTVEKGYYNSEEQHEEIGKLTFHGGNVETIAAHFGVMGVSYLLALVLAQIVSYVPVIGSSLAATLFMWGMFAAYIVRAILTKLKIEFIIDNTFQSKLSGFFSDYLVVCAFMAIQVGIIGKWILPILLVSAVGTVITYIVCLYFGERLGSDHDFERTLGVYGSCTGTIPSGLSLVRIVDPSLKTNAGAELGVMNMFLVLSTPSVLLITFAGLNMISLPVTCGGLLLVALISLIVLKPLGAWRKPTFTLKRGRIFEEETGEQGEFDKTVANTVA